MLVVHARVVAAVLCTRREERDNVYYKVDLEVLDLWSKDGRTIGYGAVCINN
jgi:hypothetical protein